MCRQVIGVSQELGRSCLFHGMKGALGASPAMAKRPLARGSGISSCEERTEDATVVPPSEGNEVRRDGRQEVVAS